MADGKIQGTIVNKADDQGLAGAKVRIKRGRDAIALQTIKADGVLLIEDPQLEPDKRYSLEVEYGGRIIYSEEFDFPKRGEKDFNKKLDPAVAADPAGNGGAFDELAVFVRSNQSDFARNADVNLDEATHFMRLYMVGHYVLAGVLRGVHDLAEAEERVSMNASSWETWWGTNGPDVLELQSEIVTGSLTEQRLMQQVRMAFDLGTEPSDRVHTEFKAAFREFIALCADDLLAVDVETAKGQGGWDDSKTQQVVSHYRKVKRALINLTEVMSRIGRPDMKNHVDRWAGIISRALGYLNEAADNAAGDVDDQHVWGFLSNLNGVAKSSIDPHIEHAPKGTKLMGDAIKVYRLLNGDRESTDQAHLRSLFYEKKIDTYKSDGAAEQQPPALVLHENASTLLEFWPANWQ